MRIIFAGTPEFAATALHALIDAGHEIVLVLTQPDRPSGRGMKLKASAVKSLALDHGIPVITPLTLSVKKAPDEAETALKMLEDAKADVLIVAAYGLILPQRALDAARGIGVDGNIKSLNIHGSLLPRWRGAAPIQRAIEARDKETGITLMKMDAGLDTGPAISFHRLPIEPSDTALSLTIKLSDLGASAVVDALSHANALTYTPQPSIGVCYAHKLLKTESSVDWNLSAEEICAKVRAFNPFPSVTITYKGNAIKVWDAIPVNYSGSPGEVLESKKRLIIACSVGAIECLKLQKAGKPPMDIGPFLQSLPIEKGTTVS